MNCFKKDDGFYINILLSPLGSLVLLKQSIFTFLFFSAIVGDWGETTIKTFAFITNYFIFIKIIFVIWGTLLVIDLLKEKLERWASAIIYCVAFNIIYFGVNYLVQMYFI
ncbi:hypothetical protein BKN14_01970 [Candidatus Gracilibacteria bacterium HOT-871]|nr:hypothetical protein BKN14_01970 [Candidatus Gracilibacteria bacterium HOT-871]